MSSVYYPKENSSELFNSVSGEVYTTCCQTPILAYQHVCPTCKVDVFPYFKEMSDEERRRLSGGFYHRICSDARKKEATRNSTVGKVT